MKIVTVILLVMVLSLNVMAAEVKKVNENKLVAQTLQKGLIGHFATALERLVQKEVDLYNQKRLEQDFVKQAVEGLAPGDIEYVLALLKKNKQIFLPKLVLEKGKYSAIIQGVPVSFGLEEILRGQILIAGHAFTINPNKSLKEINAELEAFILEKKIVERPNSGGGLLQLITSLFGISRADAGGPLLIIFVLVLIAALGIAFWLKSKRAKLQAVKDALRQAEEDMAGQASSCENSADSDTAYDRTFDLMSRIVREKTEKTPAGAFAASMLKESASGNNIENCRGIVDEFIQRTLGGPSTAAGDTSEIGELRTKLCGGTSAQQILLGDSERVGSYVRLKNCLSQFHTTHQAVTDGHRDSSFIDSDSGLIRNRDYYNQGIGH